MEDVLRGRVFSYNTDRAFGFIVDELLNMRFFHISGGDGLAWDCLEDKVDEVESLTGTL